MDTSKRKITKIDKDIYITPAQGKHTETLVWMHGLGDTADGWFEIFDSDISPVPVTTKVVLLTAPTKPVTINGGIKMPSWYDIKKIVPSGIPAEDVGSVLGLDEIVENAKRIKEVLNNELQELDGKSERLFIGGFSQGCCMALHCGLEYEKTLGGIICCSGYKFPITKELEANSLTPIFISHGEADQLIQWKSAQLSYAPIEKPERKITKVIEESLGHSISEIILSEMKTYFSNLIQLKPKPSL